MIVYYSEYSVKCIFLHLKKVHKDLYFLKVIKVDDKFKKYFKYSSWIQINEEYIK